MLRLCQKWLPNKHCHMKEVMLAEYATMPKKSIFLGRILSTTQRSAGHYVAETRPDAKRGCLVVIPKRDAYWRRLNRCFRRDAATKWKRPHGAALHDSDANHLEVATPEPFIHWRQRRSINLLHCENWSMLAHPFDIVKASQWQLGVQIPLSITLLHNKNTYIKIAYRFIIGNGSCIYQAPTPLSGIRRRFVMKFQIDWTKLTFHHTDW